MKNWIHGASMVVPDTLLRRSLCLPTATRLGLKYTTRVSRWNTRAAERLTLNFEHPSGGPSRFVGALHCPRTYRSRPRQRCQHARSLVELGAHQCNSNLGWQCSSELFWLVHEQIGPSENQSSTRRAKDCISSPYTVTRELSLDPRCL